MRKYNGTRHVNGCSGGYMEGIYATDFTKIGRFPTNQKCCCRIRAVAGSCAAALKHLSATAFVIFEISAFLGFTLAHVGHFLLDLRQK